MGEHTFKYYVILFILLLTHLDGDSLAFFLGGVNSVILRDRVRVTQLLLRRGLGLGKPELIRTKSGLILGILSAQFSAQLRPNGPNPIPAWDISGVSDKALDGGGVQ